MFNIFNKPLPYQVKKVEEQTYTRLNKKLRDNLDKVLDHYKNTGHSVKSNHLFVKILQILPTNNELSLKSYKYLIEDSLAEISNNLDLYSSVSYGKGIYPGVLFGDESEDIIFLTDSDFDLAHLEHNWKSISAVRFLSHPKSDLNFNMPDGNGYSDEVGLSVIEINLPMLACQYRLWKIENSKKEYGETTMQFVYKFMLTNSLTSFADVAYLNLIYKLFVGESIPKVKDTHPFYFNSWQDEAIDVISEMLQNYINRRISFSELLQVIKPVSKNNLREVISLNDIVFTRQIISSLIVSRAKITSLLLMWDERTLGNLNIEEIKEVNKSIKILRNDKNLESNISRTFSKQFEDFVENEIKFYL